MRRIIVLISLCIFVSHAIWAEPEHSYNDENGMSLNNIDHWMAPEDAAARINPIEGEPTSIERGQVLFNIHCSSCHGEDGRGGGPIGTSLNPKPSNLVK
jgi:mono/diheme cytochrome c family protein